MIRSVVVVVCASTRGTREHVRKRARNHVFQIPDSVLPESTRAFITRVRCRLAQLKTRARTLVTSAQLMQLQLSEMSVRVSRAELARVDLFDTICVGIVVVVVDEISGNVGVGVRVEDIVAWEVASVLATAASFESIELGLYYALVKSVQVNETIFQDDFLLFRIIFRSNSLFG